MQNQELKVLHHWDVLAISCIDGRFVKRETEWVADKTDGVFDYRTEVGCSKAILDSPLDRERLVDLIAVSKRLHSIKEIWLIDHIDCGAYGGSKEHADADSECSFHAGKLSEAARIINETYPELTVKTFYADWEKIKEV